jgi:uncharacterized protein YdbL (DUF1318 family)
MKTLIAMLAALALTCCVTVNVYFPAPAVQEAADRIVQEVRPEAAPQGSQEPAPQSSRAPRGLAQPFWGWLGPRQACAAEVDINVSTPAIRELKASIKSRFSQLEPYYRQGAVGENNQGYVDLKEAGGLDLRQRADVNRLIQAENADRKRLYEEIIKANNFGAEFLPQVAKLFANSWRKEAPAGAWVQDDNGKWGLK